MSNSFQGDLQKGILSDNACIYTVRCILHAAAPALDVKVICSEKISAFLGGIRVDFIRTSPDALNALVRGKTRMRKFDTVDRREKLPVPLEHGDCLFETDEQARRIQVNADIIALCFLVLSRAEELLEDKRDAFGRFRWQDSLSARYEFIDLPLVDEYAMLIREEMKRFLSESQLGIHTFRILATHDVDSLSYATHPEFLLKQILRPVLKHPDFSAFRRALKFCGRTLLQHGYNPETEGIRAFLFSDRKAGVQSIFYFQALAYGELDFQYSLESAEAKEIRNLLLENGITCGFHPSRLTPADDSRFQLEQERIRTFGISDPDKIRQHFLLFDVTQTPEIWEKNAIALDSTLGFADREGFRCGTCHEYPLYSFCRDSVSSVMERPLLLMDSTVQRYRKLTIQEARNAGKHLKSRCRAVGGQFVILHHNQFIRDNQEDWFQDYYCPLLENG